MRIIITGPRFHTNLHYVIKGLLDYGHNVKFIALRRGRSEEYSILTPVVIGHSHIFEILWKYVRSYAGYKFLLRWAFPPVRRFWREVKKFKPDVFIIRDPNTVYGTISILIAKLFGSKIIFYTQGPKWRKIGRLKYFIRMMFLILIDAQWITPVLGIKELGTVTMPRIHYVPFVVEPGTTPDKKQWFRNGVVNIITVGKFEPRKNHILLLQAINELFQEFNLHLTIIGECTSESHRKEFERVQNTIRTLGLCNVVNLKINLSFSEVLREYANHDLFILPSRDEPAAVSILEAMSQGLPVICSDSNGTQCYIEEEKIGYIFRTNDLQDLINKIRIIIKNREKLIAMGKHSYQLVIKRHRPDTYAKAIGRIFRNM